ncbi:MAG TPA: MFS transporter [Gaiellales bacterium]|jgi:predicted MFS family arabinose efflux permease|nr:MFS transporter [Gaiellales bacterium]
MRRLLILLYALIFVDEVALVSLVPLLPSYRDAFDLSGFESGVALSAASLAIVAGSIPGGVAGDRLGHRRTTLAAGLLLAASCLGQGLAVDLWTLVAARLAFGVSSAVIWSAGLSWLSDSAGEDRPGAVGAVVAVAGLGGMVGPVFAGVLADRIGRGAPFLILAVVALGLVVALAFADHGRQRHHEQLRLTAALDLARRNPLIAGAVTLMLLGGFSDGVVFLVAPAQLSDAGRSTATIGLILSLGSALFIACSALAAHTGRWTVTLIAGAICTALSALVLLPVLGTSASAVVAGMLIARAAPLGFMYAVALPLGVRGARSAGIGVGAANGMTAFAWGAASFAGAIVAGAGLEQPGPSAVYGFLTACCIAATAYLLALRRR